MLVYAKGALAPKWMTVIETPDRRSIRPPRHVAFLKKQRMEHPHPRVTHFRPVQANASHQQGQAKQQQQLELLAEQIIERLQKSSFRQMLPSSSSLVSSFTAKLGSASVPPDWEQRLDEHLPHNLELLLEHFSHNQVAKLLSRIHPGLLAQDLAAWINFFQGLGATSDAFYVLLMYTPEAILRSTPYTAGRAIMSLKKLGFSQQDIIERVIPCYPDLLCLSQQQLEAAAAQLSDPQLLEGPDSFQRLLFQCPAYLLPSMNEQLLPILERIKASRAGKYSESGSYWI